MNLKLVNINKNFKDIRALKKINIELAGNQVIGLLGPNGAGKTTLMRIISGFYTQKGGEILLNGKKINTKDDSYRQIIGYLPENNPLYNYMTAGEYLMFIGELRGIEKTNLKKQIIKWAKECGIGEYLSQKIETLSKGYKQRVGMAASLLGEPKILILDEPTAGLDPNQIIGVRQLIKRLAKRKLVLFSTHILPEAKAICDQLLIIKRGEIVLNEETKKIRNLEKRFIELTS